MGRALFDAWKYARKGWRHDEAQCLREASRETSLDIAHWRLFPPDPSSKLTKEQIKDIQHDTDKRMKGGWGTPLSER